MWELRYVIFWRFVDVLLGFSYSFEFLFDEIVNWYWLFVEGEMNLNICFFKLFFFLLNKEDKFNSFCLDGVWGNKINWCKFFIWKWYIFFYIWRFKNFCNDNVIFLCWFVWFFFWDEINGGFFVGCLILFLNLLFMYFKVLFFFNVIFILFVFVVLRFGLMLLGKFFSLWLVIVWLFCLKLKLFVLFGFKNSVFVNFLGLIFILFM